MKRHPYLVGAVLMAVVNVFSTAYADFFYDGSSTSAWNVDRYPQNSFTSSSVGPQPAFAETISSADDFTNRPSPYQSTFYNTQGYKTAVNGTPGGTWSLSGSLYVTADMLAGTYQPLSTGIWAGTGNNDGYYITEFLSGVNIRGFGATAFSGSQIGVFDDTTGLWSYFSTAGMTVGFNQFAISYDGNAVNYSVDGNLVTSQGPSITSQDPDVNNFTTAYLESYNFYGNGNLPNTGSYTAYWTDVTAITAAPEPPILLLAALGTAAFVLARSRPGRFFR